MLLYTIFPSLSDMAGNILCSLTSCMLNSQWIINTGATNDVVCSLSTFSFYKLVENLFINLPNEQQVPVKYVGTVRLTLFLTLFDALHTFSFNLISASN